MGEQMTFKSWLVQHNITQTELAKQLGISVTMVNAKVNGKSEFTLSQIRKICQIYDLSADIFLV